MLRSFWKQILPRVHMIWQWSWGGVPWGSGGECLDPETVHRKLTDKVEGTVKEFLGVLSRWLDQRTLWEAFKQRCYADFSPGLKNCVSFKNHVCHCLLSKARDYCWNIWISVKVPNLSLGSMFGAFSNSAKFSPTGHYEESPSRVPLNVVPGQRQLQCLETC